MLIQTTSSERDAMAPHNLRVNTGYHATPQTDEQNYIWPYFQQLVDIVVPLNTDTFHTKVP